MTRYLGKLVRLSGRLAVIVIAIVATILLVRGFDTRRGPPLELWHTVELRAEYRHGRTDVDDWQGYLELEDALFAEMQTKVYARLPPDQRQEINRYYAQSPYNPTAFAQDYNRSWELAHTEPRGAAVLIHGLTDSPYSVRSLAELLHAQGYHVIALRMPGHGTIPSGIREARWQDWMDVARLAGRYAGEIVGANKPLVFGGYSNGGALAMAYAIESVDDDMLPIPDRVILMSPEIGISPAASLARILDALSVFPFFAHSAWTEIWPEYDPWKFNSFPLNAGYQAYLMTQEVQSGLNRLKEKDAIASLPPVLTFSSTVDATVSTAATVDALYMRLLPANRSELVLFDLARYQRIKPFLKSGNANLIDRLQSQTDLPFAYTLIRTPSPDTREVVASTRQQGQSEPTNESLNMAWPREIYSLAHVAVPFRSDDPWYGNGEINPNGVHSLGNLSPRGERGVIIVPAGQFLRMRYNPFHDYLEQRVLEFLAPLER